MSTPITSKRKMAPKKHFVKATYAEKIKASHSIVVVKGKINAPAKVNTTPSTAKEKKKASTSPLKK